jgi:hypothetical protein
MLELPIFVYLVYQSMLTSAGIIHTTGSIFYTTIRYFWIQVLYLSIYVYLQLYTFWKKKYNCH